MTYNVFGGTLNPAQLIHLTWGWVHYSLGTQAACKVYAGQ